MKGYKVFNPDWTCRGYQFTCPGTFEDEGEPVICERGFHFCAKLADCFSYYEFNPKNKVAEVEAVGDVVADGSGKFCTNKLIVLRELSWHEVLELVNSGNRNSGNRNSGDWNSGNWNSGNWNSGNWNSGNWNSGSGNSGNWNSGDRNSGSGNSGNRNSGNWNSGNWNICNHSSGCFNTEEQPIVMFNKLSTWSFEDWMNSKAYGVLSRMPSDGLTWVSVHDMTEYEKEKHPESETTRGFLREVKVTAQERQRWWEELDAKSHKAVTSLPNFDADIFEKITGIKVKKKRMSVLINGMEMPTEGNETIIRILPDGTVLDQYGHHLGLKALSVSPHGRLISAKLLKADFTGNFVEAYPTGLVHAMIDDAPTIIPADNGVEEKE